MTTTQHAAPPRPLTPVEQARIDRIRVQFSGRPGLVDVVTEMAENMRSMPVPTGPRPSWCDYGEGHIFDSEASNQATVMAFPRAGHRRPHVGLPVGDALRRRRHGHLGEPYVLVMVDGIEMTPAEVDRLGSCAKQATALLREIGGAA